MKVNATFRLFPSYLLQPATPHFPGITAIILIYLLALTQYSFASPIVSQVNSHDILSRLLLHTAVFRPRLSRNSLFPLC